MGYCIVRHRAKIGPWYLYHVRVEGKPNGPKSTGAFARSHFNIVDARKSGSKMKPVCLEGGESETSWREREGDAKVTQVIRSQISDVNVGSWEEGGINYTFVAYRHSLHRHILSFPPNHQTRDERAFSFRSQSSFVLTLEEDILSNVVPSNIMLRQVCTLPPALVFVVLIVLSGGR